MKHKIALLLSIIAALLCMAKFCISYYKHSTLDYTILCAGVFILVFGITTSRNKP